MTDDPALLRAVLAAPDDDLPRLVFADWLEEAGDPARAAFIRDQVELARTPPWEPFAVAARWFRRAEAVRGTAFRAALPRAVGDNSLEWDADRGFRRGFGWAVRVRSVPALLDFGGALFAAAPAGELHLPAMDYGYAWELCGKDWFRQVRVVRFTGTSSPSGPLYVMRQHPNALGIEELVFDSASSQAMPTLIEELFETPLGQGLKRLTLKIGPAPADELAEALCRSATTPQLDAITLVTMNWDADLCNRLFASPVGRKLARIRLDNNPVFNDCLWGLTWGYRPEGLSDLRVRNGRIDGDRLGWSLGPAADALRKLDLSRNSIGSAGAAEVFGRCPERLRSLVLRQTQTGDPAVEELARSRLWPNLVELDLGENRITDAGAKALLDAPVPPDLTALALDGNPIGDAMKAELHRHFAGRVILETTDD